ncbi:MAG: helix-turn-helix domain-containing protein [Nitrososphaerota archaeon]|nr:helix-turn-helix domain-containing protein [Candidatus Bathyarchaeota archaeon]MDW8022909.1 helix-turn-helix domain-containing protein [Nitrososphaerota archaeon]
MDKYAVSPEQLAWLHNCLSSKLCMRIFNILSSERKPVNISAICRRAGCTSGNAMKHLRKLVKLGVVEEKFLSGLHMFSLRRGEMAELIFKAEKVLECETLKRDKFRGRGYMQPDKPTHARKPQSPAAYNPEN